MKLDLAGRTPEGQPPVSPFVVPSESSQRVEQVFDIGKHIKMVPPFSEKEVEKYFSHFERVATSLKWPKDVWTLLLQCMLTGKAQEVYSSLSLEQSAVYDTVKTSILHPYELVPEAYCQRFQNYTKSDQLRDLILLEEFKNCVPAVLATYLNEQKVSKSFDAAVMADEFALTHKGLYGNRDLRRNYQGCSKSVVVGSGNGVPVSFLRDTGASQSLLLEGILPLSDQTATGAQVLVRGVEMGCAVVCLHSIEIK